MKETDWAYLAGMIDGEGCIHISRTNGRYFALLVDIAGTQKGHIEYCANLLDRGFIQSMPRGGKEAAIHHWRLSGGDAAYIIRNTIPYLIAKKRQAELALQFVDHMNNSPAYNRHHPMPKHVIKYRQSLMDALKDLKLEGKLFEASNIYVPEFKSPWQQMALIQK